MEKSRGFLSRSLFSRLMVSGKKGRLEDGKAGERVNGRGGKLFESRIKRITQISRIERCV